MLPPDDLGIPIDLVDPEAYEIDKGGWAVASLVKSCRCFRYYAKRRQRHFWCVLSLQTERQTKAGHKKCSILVAFLRRELWLNLLLGCAKLNILHLTLIHSITNPIVKWLLRNFLQLSVWALSQRVIVPQPHKRSRKLMCNKKSNKLLNSLRMRCTARLHIHEIPS